MNSPVAMLAIVGYTLGALGFVAFAAQLLLRRSRTVPAQRLLLAVVAGAVWEAANAIAMSRPSLTIWIVCGIADALRYGAWLFFLASVQPTVKVTTPTGALVRRWIPALMTGMLVAVALAPIFRLTPSEGRSDPLLALSTGFWLASSIVGLVMCEQLFRSTPGPHRWGVKPLCIGLAAAFAFDLFMFSDALLLRAVDPELWSARGLVHALTLPLVLVATARNRQWTIDVAVSRNIVLGSTALLLSGLYLLTVAGAGYFVRAFGGEWGRTAQVTFLFVALLTLVILFASGTVRSRLRVFINKNFFSYRFDYRQEWLRFTQTLATPSDGRNIFEGVIQGLANLVESPGGMQWWRSEDGSFRPIGRWNTGAVDATEPGDSDFTSFLTRTGWVLDFADVLHRPEHYEELRLPAWASLMPQAWLAVPMIGRSGLEGFTILMRPRTPLELNWEVLDLLKTAARQAMAFLGHVQATEALVQARQFEAFNRMSAFLVHDLKNLVAQQSLLLKNAERHANNPEFQQDMLDTVRHVVERMNRLLLQLRSGAAPVANASSVDISAVLDRLVSYHASQGQRINVTVETKLRVLAHDERLERVLGHLIQNAVDAMNRVGEVRVRVAENQGQAVIEVEDEGHGMTPEFIRDGLFKPFVSTKSTGMGIGAYESREYISELGGTMEVESTAGTGTKFRLALPIASRDSHLEQRRHVV